MHLQNIREMYKAVNGGRGFDIVVIVSSSPEQTAFWANRLNETKGVVTGKGTRVISVEEDWPGGAGQLLGTLYAWKKGQEILDLNSVLLRGGSVAMYHTAGKGTRMAPIPAAEANNKSAIKLPRLIETPGGKTFLTILEAVIFQTGIFASSRPGRLCVFWGDQVFIPSERPDYTGNHHAEILDIRSEISLDASTWEKEWQSYGLVIPNRQGDTLQREKQRWEDLQNLIREGTIKPDREGKVVLGKSLGCFSISATLLTALLAEFAPELPAKKCKLDTDPHLWMPMTSGRSDFERQGGDASLWDRINRFREGFLSRHPGASLFGDKDIGSDSLWWDYGQARLYHRNLVKALDDSLEGNCLRQFYDLDDYWVQGSGSGDAVIENSLVINSHVKGNIRNSVLMGSSGDVVNLEDSVAVECTFSHVEGKQSLFYKCVDLSNMELGPKAVAADIALPDRDRIRMMTGLDRDGKEDWEKVLPGNPFSFKGLSELVSQASDEAE